ncbi:hypothetical protein ACIRP3_00865 [Streptomyces sp. NPDC101209]|uniref:hypothetical protein n=1 Tax=Streptomyces sp. NPDC101209 TaxID=3366129 RepID=UPI0038098BE6
MPKPVIDTLADRAMRMHHMLWHISRNAWTQRGTQQQQVFRSHGWDPPRPATTAAGEPAYDNGSGEDFLYMHRQMIAEVNQLLTHLGDPHYARVVGWPGIPAPDDHDYAVPPPFDVPGDIGSTRAIADAKQNASLQRMRQWEALFTAPDRLRSMTLGQLGARVETTVHNWMHLRWSAEMPAYRPSGDDPFDVDPKWDEPANDWLADFYSSHVNPVFWKLHGWVDKRIDDWMTANGHTGEVPWSFDPPWSGPVTHHHPMPVMAFRVHRGAPGGEALDSHLRMLEAAVDDLRSAGVRVPTPLFRTFEP